MLGLNRNVVKLVGHANNWKELFKEEKTLLNRLVGEYVVDIQHIGSTAIDGIAAKPLLDILVGVSSIGDAQKFDKHKLKRRTSTTWGVSKSKEKKCLPSSRTWRT